MDNKELAEVMQNALQTITTLTRTINDLKPDAEFGRAVMDDGTCKSMGEAAQEIADELYKRKGIRIGRNRLFAFLRRKGVLLCKPRLNQPNQRYLEAGYFVRKEKNTPIGPQPVTLVTGRGMAFIFKKVMEEYNEVDIYSN